MSGRTGTRLLVRVLLGLLVVLALVIAAAFVLLMSGWPQHALLVKVLGEALDANVEVKGLSIYKDLRIDELKAVDKKAPPSGAPLIDVSGVKASYSLFPPGDKKRYVNALSIDKLALNVDHSKVEPAPAPSAAPAPGAAPAKAAAPAKKKGKGDSRQFVPKSLDVADAQLRVAKPTFGAEIAGIQVAAKLEGGQDITINGKKASGALWTTARDAGARFRDGAISLHLKQEGKDYLLEPVDINLPGLLEVQGKGVAKIGDDTNIDLGFPRFLATNLDLSAASPDDFAMPVRFKKLDLSGTRLKAQASIKSFKSSLAETKVNIAAEDLALGPKDHELYEGNLSISGASGTQSDLQLDLEATLNRGQKIVGGLSGDLKDLKIHAGAENWSREDLVAALSKDLRRELDSVPGLHGATATFDMNLKLLAFEATMKVNPLLAQADGASIPVEFSATFKGNVLALATGKGQYEALFSVKASDGSLSLATMVGPSLRHTAKITLDKFDGARLVNTLAPASALKALSGSLTGTVDVQAAKEWDDAKMALDLTADAFGVGGFPLAAGAPLKGTATLASNKQNGFEKKGGLDLKLGDGTSLAVGNAQFNTALSHVDLPFEIKSDLQVLAGAGWFDAAKGALSISGAVKRDEAVASGKLDIDAACESAALSKGRGTLDGFLLKAPIVYAGDKGLSGSGELKIAKALLNGISVSDVAAAIQAEGEAIRVSGLSGKVCDGALSGDAEIGVLDVNKPAKINAQIKGVNLESLSKGLAVPALNMTGPADAAIILAADSSGIKELKASVESTAQVSVSTAFLETLLASSYVRESGVKAQLDKMVKEGGKGGQTALDSLKLTLARDGERYTLTVALGKGERHVTIDIHMDGAALPATANLIQQLGSSAK